MHGNSNVFAVDCFGFYARINERLVNEMEKTEEEFHAAYEQARKYLDSRKDDQSNVASDIISIEMFQRMTSYINPETVREAEIRAEQNLHQKVAQEVRTFGTSTKAVS